MALPLQEAAGALEVGHSLAAYHKHRQLQCRGARRTASRVETLSQIQKITACYDSKRLLISNGYFHPIIREQEALRQSAVGFIVKAYIVRDMNEIGLTCTYSP